MAWIGYIAYSVEIVGPTKRSISGTLVSLIYGFGYMISSGFAYLIPDRREFNVGLSIFAALGVFLAPFYPESPGFLYSRGRYKKGRQALKTMAAKTNVILTDSYLEMFESGLSRGDKEEMTEQKVFSTIDLFRNRRMLMVSLNIGTAFLLRIQL